MSAKKSFKVLKSFSELGPTLVSGTSPLAVSSVEKPAPKVQTPKTPTPPPAQAKPLRRMPPGHKPEASREEARRQIPRFNYNLFMSLKDETRAKLKSRDHTGAILSSTSAIDMALGFIKKIRSEADYKREHGDLEGAMKEYEVANKTFHLTIPVFYFRRIARFQNKDFSGAMEDYDMVIKYQPEFNGAYLKRVLIKERLGDFDGVIADLIHVASKMPDNPSIYFKLAEMRLLKGDIEAGLKDYKKAFMCEKSNPKNLLKKGLFLLRKAKFDASLHIFEQGLEKIRKITARFHKIKTLKGMKEFEIDDKTLFLKLALPVGRFYFNTGEIKRKKGLYSEAEADYTKSIEYSPANLKAFLMRAEVRSLLKNFQGAGEDYTHVLSEEPSTQILLKRGTLYFAMGEYSKAIQDYLAVLEKEPYDIPVYTKLADARMAAKDYEKADLDYSKVIEFKPNDSSLYYKRGLARLKSGRREEGSTDLKKGLTLDPFNTGNTLKRAQELKAKGRSKEALLNYSKAIETMTELLKGIQKIQKPGQETFAEQDLKPAADLIGLDIAPLYYEKALLLLKSGHLEEAVSALSSVLAFSPKNSDALFERARAYTRNSEPKKAMQDIKTCLDLNPEDDRAYILRAAIYAEKSDKEAAIKDFNKAIKLNPHNPENHLEFGTFLFRQGMYEGALFSLEKAIEKEKNNPQPFATISRILLDCPEEKYRNPTESVNYALKACEIRPEAGNFELLAAAYSLCGNFSEALKMQEKADSMNPSERSKKLLLHYREKKNWLTFPKDS